jgi:hypothetical protein
VKFNDEGFVDLVEGESPRINFDGFFNAFTTVFVILTYWDVIMFDFARAKGSVAVVYFISYIVLG